MQDFENIVIQKLPVHLTFYYRYIDRYVVISAALSESVNEILDTFNSLHSRLQFTVEVEDEDKLIF